MAMVSLMLLSLKTIFLVAVTSASRLLELSALSVNPNLCMFHKDNVVLMTDLAFIPKVNSIFHKQQELILPLFCLNPSHPKEKERHMLDIRRVLRFYTGRTQTFCKIEALFVTIQGKNLG